MLVPIPYIRSLIALNFSHQAFGVDFIAQREGRKPSSLASIWQQQRVNGTNW